jgi:hypothetical protein
MASDDIVTNRDTRDAPEVVVRAALSAFVYYCSPEALAVVRGTVAALPEGERVEEDIQLLLWEER